MIITMPFRVEQTVRGGFGYAWIACYYYDQKCDSVGTKLTPLAARRLFCHIQHLCDYTYIKTRSRSKCIFSSLNPSPEWKRVHPNGTQTLIANLKAACCADNLSYLCVYVCVRWVLSLLCCGCSAKKIDFFGFVYIYIYMRAFDMENRQFCCKEYILCLSLIAKTLGLKMWV